MMIYILMIFIGITIGLIISKFLDIRKAEIDKKFLDLVDKVILEEKKEEQEVKKKEFKSDTKRY